MKKEFLECGKIVSTHGVRGEVRVQPWCDTPDFLEQFDTLWTGRDRAPVHVQRARAHGNIVILKLEGVDTVEQAAACRGQVLYLRRDQIPLEEGEYLVQDLLGCRVVDADTGADYGQVYDVRPTGANDVYYLRDAQGRERLVPAIPQVVLERDIDGGVITIRPLEGLFDD